MAAQDRERGSAMDAGRHRFARHLMRLEERIVLDAAVVETSDHDHDAQQDDVVDAPNADQPAGVSHDTHPDRGDAGAPSQEGANDAQPPDAAPSAADNPAEALRRLIAVSSDVDTDGQLADAVRGDTNTVVFDASGITLDSLLARLVDAVGDEQVDRIALATHGTAGEFSLAHGSVVNLGTLDNPQMQAFWRGLARLIDADGRIDLLGCNIAGSDDGVALVDELESLTGVEFAASTDLTGNTGLGGDWVLETDGVLAGPLYFDSAALAEFGGALAPSITDSGDDVTVLGGAPGEEIDPLIVIDDGGAAPILGASVRIKSGYVDSEDRLDWDHSITDADPELHAAYGANEGELLLWTTGSPATSDFQDLLRSVTYENTSTTPSTHDREIFVIIGDHHAAYKYSIQTGHYYQRLDSPAFAAWTDARDAADSITTGGLQGYLATVSSASENGLLASYIAGPFPPAKLWLGGLEQDGDGMWYWVTGPESENADGRTLFSNGAAAVDGAYANWQAGQPDLGGAPYARMEWGGVWLDELGGGTGMFVEFGGMSTDVESSLGASITIHVEAPNHAPVLDTSGQMRLTKINEDQGDIDGNTIAEILASAGGDRVTDYNSDPEGLAITAVDNTNGTWQYSTDGGGVWVDIGAVSDGNALLLRDTDLVRFMPDADYNGTIDPGLMFRAWDQTTGNAGDYVDASTTGTDTAFSTATGAASITIEPVNDDPVSGASLSDVAIDEDSPFSYTVPADAFTDIDVGDTLAYSARLADGSPLPAWLTFDPATRTLSGTPTNDDVGTVDIEVVATDSDGASVSQTFELAVSNVNDAPVVEVSLTDQAASEDVAFSWQVPADAFADVDAGDMLSYSAMGAGGSSLPSWLTFDPSTRTFRGTPGNDDVGRLTLVVVATDASGATASDTFDLVVSNVNDAPQLVVAPSDQQAAEDTAFSYTLPNDIFEDIDAGDSLRYSAALADGSVLPAWLAFDPVTRTFRGTPGNADVGILAVQVVATDGSGQSATAVFVLDVTNVNDAPVFDGLLPDQQVIAGTPFELTIPASGFVDVDPGDTLAFSAVLDDGTALPGWLAFDAATRRLYGTPGDEDAGPITVRIVATDTAGANAVATFSLVVAVPEGEPADTVPEVPSSTPTGPVAPPRTDGGRTPSVGPAEPAADSGPADAPAAPTADGSPVSGEDAGDFAADDAPVVDTDAGESASANEVAAESATNDPGTESAEAAGDKAGVAAPNAEAGASDDGDGAVAGEAAANTDAAADGASIGNGTASAAGGSDTAGVRAARTGTLDESDEQLSVLKSAVQDAIFSGELLSDESQPIEFRATWDAIIGHYAGSGEALTSYLQSAFRTVTESALLYQSSEQTLATMEEELQAAIEAGIDVDVEELLALLSAARDDVKVASSQLEAAIHEGAEAGRRDAFDQVLEDALEATLARLMHANEQLYVESQAAAAVAELIREARIAGMATVDRAALVSAAVAARDSAHTDIMAMRKSWDRVAQDVFSAFVARLASHRGEEAPPVPSPMERLP